MPVPRKNGSDPTTESSPTDTPALGAVEAVESSVFESVGAEELDPSTLKGPQRARFFLRFMPGAGQYEPVVVDGTSWLLPVLNTHFLSPGAAGVRTRGAHENLAAAWQPATERAQREGWIYLMREATALPPEMLPPGLRGGYLQRARTRMGGPNQPAVETYLEAWSVPILPTPRTAKTTRFRFDHDRYNRFRLWLLATGRLPLPVEGEMDERRRGLLAALSTARASVGPEPAVRRVNDEAEAALAALDEAKTPEVAA